MADKLVNVKASTAQEFIDGAHKAMKDPKKLGETKYSLDVKFQVDSKSKTITKATMTLKMTTTRVHWAGQGKAKPDKANMDAINKIEDLNEAHEKAHRDGYQAAFDKNHDAYEKEMAGKSQQEAQKIVDKMKADLLKACEDLHKSGGQIDIKDNGQGKITVTESAEGPGGCS